jgi:hypothetical protein
MRSQRSALSSALFTNQTPPKPSLSLPYNHFSCASPQIRTSAAPNRDNYSVRYLLTLTARQQFTLTYYSIMVLYPSRHTLPSYYPRTVQLKNLPLYLVREALIFCLSLPNDDPARRSLPFGKPLPFRAHLD